MGAEGEGPTRARKGRKKGLGRWVQRRVMDLAEQMDFVGLMGRAARTPGGLPWLEAFDRQGPPDHPDQPGLLARAVELTLAQLQEEGQAAVPSEVLAAAQEISCQYDPAIHRVGAAGVNGLMSHLFTHADPRLPFISPDHREIQHLDLLQGYRRQGLGVVYLVNHSSHVDEFIADCVFHDLGLGLGLFAAGTNMMAIGSLARLLMIGSYTVQRKGAGRVYLATLFNYCRAISEIGGQQGIFLEAWAGGARTRDGSLRYPRRLVTLRGALAAAGEVVVQPVAISYAAVPEDLSLAARQGPWCWVRGLAWGRALARLPLHPQAGLWRALDGLYGRAYLTMPQPRLLGQLKADHEAARGDLSLDEYVALTAIRDIARAKKVMASQLTARALLRARRQGSQDLAQAYEQELEGLKEYHQATFGAAPDLEDFILEHPPREVLKDGLRTLARRGVAARRGKDAQGLPKIKNERGLAFYATHGDRRLYSPQAKENIVVVGAGDWGFALAHLVGNRIVEEKRYLNASLTLFDSRPEVAEQMGVLRNPPGRFAEHRLPKNVFVTSDPMSAFKKASDIILASPPSQLAQQVGRMLDNAEQGLRVIVATCAFEPVSRKLPCQMIADEAARRGRSDLLVYSLVGPVSEEDLVLLRPVRGVLAGPAEGLKELADLFAWPPVEVVTSTDARGVQLAGILAQVYSLWGGYLQRTGAMAGPAQVGHYLAATSAEALALALALGGRAETFSAASPAWIATYAAAGLAGPVLDFGRRLGKEAKRSRDLPAAAQKLAGQMERDGLKVRALEDLRLAAAIARQHDLSLPILAEACQKLWGE